METRPWSGGAGRCELSHDRGTIVVKAVQSKTPGGQPALAELCRLYWSPLYMFGRLRGLLREQVGRNAPDQAHTGEKIHARYEALLASEGRSDP